MQEQHALQRRGALQAEAQHVGKDSAHRIRRAGLRENGRSIPAFLPGAHFGLRCGIRRLRGPGRLAGIRLGSGTLGLAAPSIVLLCIESQGRGAVNPIILADFGLDPLGVFAKHLAEGEKRKSQRVVTPPLAIRHVDLVAPHVFGEKKSRLVVEFGEHSLVKNVHSRLRGIERG